MGDHASRPPDLPPIEAPSSVRGHVPNAAATWVDFDPSSLVVLAEQQAPELVAYLAQCRRAGWTCKAYALFVPDISEGGIRETVILEAKRAEYAVDVDGAGRPLGVELLHVALRSEHH
jgi:hypothetical protein